MTRLAPTVAFEHLTSRDRELLTEATGVVPEPANVLRLLAHPSAHDAVFGSDEPDVVPFLHTSPFLVFGVAVGRAAEELRDVGFTHEWVGLRQRVPVFDVEALRDFVDDDVRRIFLMELLASYTHVVSGSTWVRTSRGFRRHRFSELDPVGLASMLDVVPETERPGVYRRLGDLSLFLTGVFPDHTAARGVSEVDRTRLSRSGGLGETAEVDHPLAEQFGAVGLFEELGRRWYRLAADAARGPLVGTMNVAGDVAERFRDARRVLNYVTDRFLFPFRREAFGAGD